MEDKQEKKSFLLRVNSELWSDLEKMASDQLRSINGQIEFILRDAVRKWRGRDKATRNV